MTAMRSGDRYYVDDFALERDATWEEDGRMLLLAAWEDAERRGASALRVVTAARDAPKVAMLKESGMAVELRWWVKPLDAAPGTSYSGQVEGDGYDGFLTAAPPVYSPGGPVAIINRFNDPSALARAESHAHDFGVVLVILPIEPRADDREETARTGGYEVASEFYVGRPR